MASVPINSRVELTDEFVGDILVTAFDGSYGACWDWARAGSSPALEANDKNDWKSFKITFVVDDCSSATQRVIYGQQMEKGGLVIDADVIAAGLARLAEGDDRVIRAIMDQDAGDLDAIDVNMIVQYGVFGEQVYA